MCLPSLKHMLCLDVKNEHLVYIASQILWLLTLTDYIISSDSHDNDMLEAALWCWMNMRCYWAYWHQTRQLVRCLTMQGFQSVTELIKHPCTRKHLSIHRLLHVFSVTLKFRNIMFNLLTLLLYHMPMFILLGHCQGVLAFWASLEQATCRWTSNMCHDHKLWPDMWCKCFCLHGKFGWCPR